MKSRFFWASGVMLSVAACGTTATTTTTTGGDTRTLTTSASLVSQVWNDLYVSQEVVDALSLQDRELGVVTNAKVGSAVYVAGRDGDDVQAVAGFVSDGGVPYRLWSAGVTSGLGVGAARTAGTASYEADWEAVQLRDVRLENDQVAWTTLAENGTVTLTADFSDGTIEGADGPLTVAGQIVANDLSGKVAYRGIDGGLDGEVGADGVIGAFSGKSDVSVFSGGFVGEVTP